MSSLGERLKTLRGNVARDKYGPMLGVSLTTIANYENNARTPDASFLLRVLSIHPLTNPTWLLTGDGPMEISKDSLPSDKPKQMEHSLLEDVIAAVEEYLAVNRRSLAPDKKAKLITILYDIFAEKEEKKADRAVIINLFESFG